jgi:hypothetical protein
MADVVSDKTIPALRCITSAPMYAFNTPLMPQREIILVLSDPWEIRRGYLRCPNPVKSILYMAVRDSFHQR